MKTKMMLLAALVSAAAWSANAGVRIGFSLGLPAPVVVARPVVVAPVVATPVVTATVMAPAPVVVAPAPVVVATVPPCHGVGYVWAPGYWAGKVWVAGGWHHRPVPVYHGPYYGYRR